MDSLEDWDFIQGPNFSLEREDFDTLDERLTSAFQHLILPPNWSVLGSIESGILIFKGVWCIVFFGTIFKIFYTGRFEKISLLMYLGMGWLVILDIDSVINSFTSLALIYLALGGFLYTTGVYFYSNKTIKETHAIWHVFCFHEGVNLSLYENASALRGLEQYQNIIANNIAASHV